MCISISIKDILEFAKNDKLKEAISSICPPDDISKYFKTTIRDGHEIDYFFYPLGLRKKLPIMDWLYLEYIKFINKKSKIKELVIFPTIDMSAASQLDSDFNEFCANINMVFRDSGIKLNIINPRHDIYFDVQDLISKDFIETLKYIGSKKYFDFLREYPFYIKITSISDFDEIHPINERIKDIFTHIYKSWCIVNYIKKNVNITRPVNISTIFLQCEVDKLGVMKYFSEKEDNITFYPVLGKTQFLKRNIPIPVFVEEETICIFDDENDIINKALKINHVLKKYNSILKNTIGNVTKRDTKNMIIDGEKQWQVFAVKKTSKMKNAWQKDFYLFLGLIDKVKSLYKDENI